MAQRVLVVDDDRQVVRLVQSYLEQAGYQVLITTDQNLRYQQNLSERQIAIVVLGSTSWPRIQTQIANIRDVIKHIGIGGYYEIAIP